MPIPEINGLSPTSDDAQIKAATTSCIATEMNNGHPQDQAIMMCSSMIGTKTGKGKNQPVDNQPNPSGGL